MSLIASWSSSEGPGRGHVLPANQRRGLCVVCCVGATPARRVEGGALSRWARSCQPWRWGCQQCGGCCESRLSGTHGLGCCAWRARPSIFPTRRGHSGAAATSYSVVQVPPAPGGDAVASGAQRGHSVVVPPSLGMVPEEHCAAVRPRRRTARSFQRGVSSLKLVSRAIVAQRARPWGPKPARLSAVHDSYFPETNSQSEPALSFL